MRLYLISRCRFGIQRVLLFLTILSSIVVAVSSVRRFLSLLKSFLQKEIMTVAAIVTSRSPLIGRRVMRHDA
jgi:hypothetical protein